MILPNFMFRRPGWSKTSNLSQIFNPTQISKFCQISCFAGTGWSKISHLSKIFNVIQISLFCQILCFTYVKTSLVKIGVKFSMWLKFLDYGKFHSSYIGPGWSKISNWKRIFNVTQIYWFCQILCFTGQGWSKISNFSQIFNLTQISSFCQICRTRVVKILNLNKFFNVTQTSWFCQISCFAVSGRSTQIWAKFSKRLKFLDFEN